MQDFFFELIRVALLQENDLSRKLSEKEWYELYSMAQNHAMLGICYGGLQKLKSGNQQPPQELIYKWVGEALQIEESNKRINSRCVELQRRLTKDGFRSCVLKGQGNALMYGRLCKDLAFKRQAGDIDVWLDGGIDRIMKYVQDHYPTDDVGRNHIRFDIFTDMKVELHYTLSHLIDWVCDRRLQKWLRSEMDRQMVHLVAFGEEDIVVPTNDFNLVYQLLHIHRHLFGKGIGLRHFMDYYVLLCTAQVNKSEKEMILNLTSRFGLEKFATALMWVLGYVFHLDQERMLWEPNEVRGRFLLDEVMKMGNFGHNDTRFDLKEKNNVVLYFQLLKNRWRFFQFFPREVLWQPANIILVHLDKKRLKKRAAKLRLSKEDKCYVVINKLEDYYHCVG